MCHSVATISGVCGVPCVIEKIETNEKSIKFGSRSIGLANE